MPKEEENYLEIVPPVDHNGDLYDEQFAQKVGSVRTAEGAKAYADNYGQTHSEDQTLELMNDLKNDAPQQYKSFIQEAIE